MNEVAKQEVLAALWQLAPVCREPALQGPCSCWAGVVLAIRTVEGL